MLARFFCALFASALFTRVLAQNGPTAWTATPFNPPAYPLAVKSPYLNAWLPQGNGPTQLSATWPRTGTPSIDILGWYAAITVDGKPYSIMGGAPDPAIDQANQTAVQFTPTTTSFLLTAGPVVVNASFLSPVEPTDLVRQSLPFSYFYLSITSSDGKPHAIKVYSDISGEWISGDDSLSSNWTSTADSSIVYLQTQLTAPTPFTEILDRPQDGTVYYCMKTRAGLTWQIGRDNDNRGLFANGTGLANKTDPNFHGIGTPFFDVFSIAVDLGNITQTTDHVVWAIGVVRDPVIKYTNANVQPELRSSYYWSQFGSIHDVIEDVLTSFPTLLAHATALDAQILGDARNAAGANYADLLALTTRQALAALDFTLVRSANGQWNTSDVKAFLRDTGGVGSGGVNAVDVLYAAFPLYLYLNPDIVGHVLRPLLEYEEGSQYPNPYAAQDLGANYSIATGNTQGHNQEVEQTANMLIMAFAHAGASGDGSLIGRHYNLLRNWADYLVNNSLAPNLQRTSISDGITVANQTNLALKGIIGIGAMGKISSFAGHADDASHYQNIATTYAQQWQALATAPGDGHLLPNYGADQSTTGVIYNLFADKLLQLNLIPQTVYDSQTSLYHGLAAQFKFGIPLNSGNAALSRSDWTMFAASTVTDPTARDALVSLLHAYASPNLENAPFAVMYNPTNGSQMGGFNSPAQGAMFSLLSLKVPMKLVAVGGPSKHIQVGAIAGGAVAALAVVAIAVGAFFFFQRRRRNRPDEDVGYYSRVDRIQRVKPAVYASGSDSVLELRPSEPFLVDSQQSQGSNTTYTTSTHPGGAAATGSGSDSLRSNSHLGGASTRSAEPPGPFRVWNPADDGEQEAEQGMGSGAGSVVSGAQRSVYSIGSPPLPNPPGHSSSSGPKHGMREDELRSEVDDLRREIERMKEERVGAVEAPPSYDAHIL